MYTAKTNKDLGMSCYIQVEYSVFLRRRPVILGRSVESRTPLEEFFLFLNFCFLTVYMHIFQI